MVLTCCLSLPALAAGSAVAATPPGYLYVITGFHGKLKAVSKGHSLYQLTLAQSTDVTYFSDRPQRRSGVIPLDVFVKDWTTFGFTAEPPNAALVISGAPANRDTFIFRLTRPRLGRHGTVQFTALVFPATRVSSGLHDLAARADTKLPRSFRTASVFIDNGNVAGAPTGPAQITAKLQDVASGHWLAYDAGGNIFPVAEKTQAGVVTVMDLSSSGAIQTNDYVYIGTPDGRYLQPGGITRTGCPATYAETFYDMEPPVTLQEPTGYYLGPLYFGPAPPSFSAESAWEYAQTFMIGGNLAEGGNWDTNVTTGTATWFQGVNGRFASLQCTGSSEAPLGIVGQSRYYPGWRLVAP
ncbi:MAG TPA: hypothetical protein VGO14_08730 [Solirubrobacteraceae bacterium]|nr:hypothetical protein [Solirubrobacteraceae bacterium]